MNNKVEYAKTTNYQPASADGGFPAETENVLIPEEITFGDYLRKQGLHFRPDGWSYIIVDDSGAPTGDAYKIVTVKAAK